MNPFSRSNNFLQSIWIYLGLSLYTGLSLATQRCPEDPTIEAHSCFTDYSTQYQSVMTSEEKLCCGMHAEILRAFCYSFEQSLHCVAALRYICPPEKHRLIDQALVNFEGSLPALRQLCEDDKIIETYAMHRRCFHDAKFGSENCFQRYFNGSHVTFLTRVSMGSDQFCRKMRNTVHCVEDNVRKECGSNAAVLAPLLTKPMVAGSAQCDYTVINKPKTTQRPSHGRHAYISDEYDGSPAKTRNNRKNRNNNNSNSNGGNNSGCDVTASRHLTAIAVITMLLFFLLRYQL